jgi:hypothetical protein
LLALAIGLLGLSPADAKSEGATPPATVNPAAPGAVASPSQGTSSVPAHPAWEAEVIRQLLEIPGADKIDSQAFEVSARRWRQSYWVVLVRAWQDGRARSAALGVYGDGESPAPARQLATSGRLTVEDEEEVLALDLAPFRVTPSTTAIGIRLQRKTSYAGGGEGSAGILRLYLQNGRKLERILSVVTDYECELAGDWNEDGTRDRYSVSGASILVVSKRKTDGHFDLEERQGKKRIAVYRWNGKAYSLADYDRGADLNEQCEVAHAEE